MNCKYCQSTKVIKYGKHKSVQYYFCKNCKRKFAHNDAIKGGTKWDTDAHFNYLELEKCIDWVYSQFKDFYTENHITARAETGA